MTLWRLIIREILHRKLDFALGAVAVFISVTALVSVIEVLDRHEGNTGSILARVQAKAERRVEAKRLAAANRVADEQAKLKRDLEAERSEAARKVRLEERIVAREVARNESEVADEVARNEAEVHAAVAKLDDEMRKAMKKMGFNIYILPKRPESGSLLPEDEKPAYMPEEYVSRLANSTIITVRHLLPLLECRVEWPEQGGREFILVGMRGEVPLVNKTPKKPIAQPIKDGTIVLGHKLWTRLKLKVGQTVTMLGHTFTVAACYPERGTKDDSRAWIPLGAAQEMLHAKGLIKGKQLISAIWALECRCAWRDLARVRDEINKILPDTIIKEDSAKALARAEARKKVEEDGLARIERMKADGRARIERVKANGQARVEQTAQAGQARIEDVETKGLEAISQAETDGKAQVARVRHEGAEELRHQKESRNRLQGQLEMLIMVVIPVSIVGSAAWVGLMAYGSVRRRRREIGILRAIGMRARQVTTVLLARAVLLGLLGAAAGWCAGSVVASRLSEAPEASARGGGLGVAAMLLILLAAPVLTALATAIPAAIAGQQDPASVLQEE